MHKVQEAGLDGEIGADSAGTGAWHEGEPPHPGTRAILQAQGITYDHRARVLSRSDLTAFDYIITMDDQNHRDVLQMGQTSATVARLLDYAPETGVREVPDPYYTGGYDVVHRLVNAACDGLLASIRRDHGL